MFQLEKCLKAQIDKWEQEHGTEFQVNGQQFLEYVQQQWDQHHNEKEKEKLERVSDVTDFTLAEILPLDECVNEYTWFHLFENSK